jgi:hypothetical protein
MTIGIAGASGHDSRLGKMRFAGWLGQPSRQIPNTSLQPPAGTGRRKQHMAGSKSMLALAFLITRTL